MYKAILILLALIAVQTSATDVNICGTGGWFTDPEVDTTSVMIEGCDKPPCTAVKGQLLNYSMKFTPSWLIRDATVQVKARRFGISISLRDGPSMCDKIFRVSDNSPATCPLSPGVEYIFKDVVSVPEEAPVSEATVQLAIVSGSEMVKCVEIPAVLR